MVAKPLCHLYKNIIKPLDRARYPELRYVINTYDDVSLQVEVAGLTNCRHIGGVTNCVNYTNIHLRSTTYENNRNDQPKNYYYQICAFTLCSGSGEPFKNCVNFGLLL